MAKEATTTTEQTTTTTQTATENPLTPSTAVNVDIDAITQAAATKAAEVAQSRMEGTFKSMLKQSGLDSDAIAKITAEWQAKQVTPEQALAAKDAEIAARDAKITAYEQDKILRTHGLTDDEDVEIYGIRINKFVTAEKTFEQAATEYFMAHPRPTKIPATATFGGTGKTPITPPDADRQAKIDAARAAMKIK